MTRFYLKFTTYLGCLAALAACEPGTLMSPDTGTDTGLPDSGPPDSGTDTGQPDTATPDTGTPDTGPECVDLDFDGYGEGCDLGDDCNDSAFAVNPGAAEACNDLDDDCDGATDEDIETPACELTMGVCAGTVSVCEGGGFKMCDSTEYGPIYEMAESICDGLDNDCDGETDEGCDCSEGDTRACGTDVGACMPGVQRCVAGTYGPCEDDVEATGESCNGADDDCDGDTDEAPDLTAPNCPLQLGVCLGSKRACGGDVGWVPCSGTDSYGDAYQTIETMCDGMDNDCDGTTDEGCECTDGETQPCGTDTGVCEAGTQTCTAGSFGSCAGEVLPSDESCDGADEDCDGVTDEDVTLPSCALTDGVCAGATQRCAGAAGFSACIDADYGLLYEADESRCDGQDNDCDGTTDEGCDCVDGDTQPCGSSLGACAPGTQTCAAGTFGACVGGTGPSDETCNGIDDDCDGITDDNLVAPSCALTEGVCDGSVQICGGVAGWEACDGTDSYGASYLEDEDGLAREGECDGLDNDCNGTVDDRCLTLPLVTPGDDVVLPDLNGVHLVYMRNFDGNWDLVLTNIVTGDSTRLTTTAVSEFFPKVYGNYVTFVRGEDADAHVHMINLLTGAERQLSTRESGSPDIHGGTIVFEEWDGTDWEIIVYEIATDMTRALLTGAGASNEIRPSIRGPWFSWLGDASGEFLVYAVDLSAMTPTVIVQTPASMSAAGQANVVMDYTTLTWSDGRNVTDAMPDTTSDFDVYGALLSGTGSDVFPDDESLVIPLEAQFVTDSDSTIVVYNDYQDMNADVGFVTYSSLGAGTPVRITTHPGTQADPTTSAGLIVWEDNRRGVFDLYFTSVDGIPAPTMGDIAIDEILADPAAGADVNGDGDADTSDDEFVEIVNRTAGPVDLSGLTLSDAVGVRHTFAGGTVLQALGSIVVFGGGMPTGFFAGARAVPASSGQLGLNNGGDTLTIRDGATVVETVTYGSASFDESIHRVGLTGAFTRHSMITGSVGSWSPGTAPDSFPY